MVSDAPGRGTVEQPHGGLHSLLGTAAGFGSAVCPEGIATFWAIAVVLFTAGSGDPDLFWSQRMFLESVMRSLLLLAVCGGVLSTGLVARADDYADLKPLIEKGIESAGGRDKLTKRPVTVLKLSGVYHATGNAANFTGRVVRQRGEKMRLEIDNVYTVVFNGTQGWISANGAVVDLAGDQADNVKNDLHVEKVTSLLLLGTDKSTVTKLGETQVNGKPAVGIKVDATGSRPVELYLDKQSGQVVKRVHETKSTEQGGMLVKEETIYSNFQTVDGIQIPTKSAMSRDGSKYVDLEVTQIDVPEKANESEFQRP